MYRTNSEVPCEISGEEGHYGRSCLQQMNLTPTQQPDTIINQQQIIPQDSNYSINIPQPSNISSLLNANTQQIVPTGTQPLCIYSPLLFFGWLQKKLSKNNEELQQPGLQEKSNNKNGKDRTDQNEEQQTTMVMNSEEQELPTQNDTPQDGQFSPIVQKEIVQFSQYQPISKVPQVQPNPEFMAKVIQKKRKKAESNKRYYQKKKLKLMASNPQYSNDIKQEKKQLQKKLKRAARNKRYYEKKKALRGKILPHDDTIREEVEIEEEPPESASETPPSNIPSETAPPSHLQSETPPPSHLQSETPPPSHLQSETPPSSHLQYETPPPTPPNLLIPPNIVWHNFSPQQLQDYFHTQQQFVDAQKLLFE